MVGHNAAPDGMTPADTLTPHGDAEQLRIEPPEEKVVQGLLDPRPLPGPEILDPPPISLPPPDGTPLDADLDEE
jgi:hypothetical protein